MSPCRGMPTSGDTAKNRMPTGPRNQVWDDNRLEVPPLPHDPPTTDSGVRHRAGRNTAAGAGAVPMGKLRFCFATSIHRIAELRQNFLKHPRAVVGPTRMKVCGWVWIQPWISLF